MFQPWLVFSSDLEVKHNSPSCRFTSFRKTSNLVYTRNDISSCNMAWTTYHSKPGLIVRKVHLLDFVTIELMN